MEDIEKVKQAKEEAGKEYNKIQKVWCPYLNDYVYFNIKGFNHLIFKSWNTTRTLAEQYTRLRLLRFVPEVVNKSHTLQEYDERKMFVRQKINSRWESRMKVVYYYVFVAIIRKARLKVVIKEIEGGEKYFYSLYPSWWKVKSIDGCEKKKLYSGDLEKD